MLIWLIQFVASLFWLFGDFPADAGWPWVLCLIESMNLLVGVMLALILFRSIYWHPRRNTQTAVAVLQERQRIARELHDLVGSQLVNAMTLLDSPAARSHPAMLALEQCMLDLRLLVEVMGDRKGDLADKLASLRHRIQPVLDKRGIHLTWLVEVGDGDTLPRHSHACELCRLVQEAVSNVLQHSKATHMTIELRLLRADSPTQWLLRIMDNGVGLGNTQGSGRQGHGVANMKRRVRRLGGNLSIVSEEGMGTEIAVVVDTARFAQAPRRPG